MGGMDMKMSISRIIRLPVALTLPQACLLLKAVLPMKPFDKEQAITIIRYHQVRNYIAYKSHKKKKKAELQNLAL